MKIFTNKIIKNIAWLLLDNMVKVGVSGLTIIAIARGLGPAEFGRLNYALAVTGIFSAIAGLGLQNVVVKRLVSSPGRAQEILITGAILQSCLGGTMAYLCVLSIGYLTKRDDIVGLSVILIVGVTLFLKGCEQSLYWFESRLDMRHVIIAQNVSLAVYALLKIGAVTQGGGVMVIAWILLLESLTTGLVLLAMLRLKGVLSRNSRIDIIEAKILLRESWPLMLSGLTVVAYMRIDQLMLGILVDDAEVGLYSAAIKISEIWAVVPMVVIISTYPSLIYLRGSSTDRYYQRFQMVLDVVVGLSLCLVMVGYTFGDRIVHLLFGGQYLSASGIIGIHIWSIMFSMLSAASGRWLIAEGLQLLALLRNVYGLVLNVILNLIFIPNYGAVGAAWATLASFVVVGLLSDYLNSKTRRIFWMKMSSLNIVGLLGRMALLIGRMLKNYP